MVFLSLSNFFVGSIFLLNLFSKPEHASGRR